MTDLMKKFTNIVAPTYISIVKYLQSLVHSASEHLYNEILLWIKNRLVSDSNNNIVNL